MASDDLGAAAPVAPDEGRPTGTLRRLAEHLATEWWSEGDWCDLTARGGERCEEPAVAVRWEDGFADKVCEQHAERATKRGALVVRPRRHDGTLAAPAPAVPAEPARLTVMHNPWDHTCSRRVFGEQFRDGEVCRACHPALVPLAETREAAALRERIIRALFDLWRGNQWTTQGTFGEQADAVLAALSAPPAPAEGETP